MDVIFFGEIFSQWLQKKSFWPKLGIFPEAEFRLVANQATKVVRTNEQSISFSS